jgi:poly(A) polymerase Pap1
MGRQIRNSDLAFLKKLKRSRVEARKVLIQKAKPEHLRLLTECVLNVCNGNIKCTDQQKANLVKHAKHLHAVCDACRPVASRKKIYKNQSGGFIGTLLSVAIPAIATLIANQLSSK